MSDQDKKIKELKAIIIKKDQQILELNQNIHKYMVQSFKLTL
jgi:ribosome-interacting GTPase 1